MQQDRLNVSREVASDISTKLEFAPNGSETGLNTSPYGISADDELTLLLDWLVVGDVEFFDTVSALVDVELVFSIVSPT